MAISLIASIAQTQDQFNPTTTGINTTGADLLVAVVADHHLATPGTPSDSKGNTWTGLTVQLVTGVRLRIFYATNSPTVGSGHTFTYTEAGGSYATISFAAFSGAHATAPFDVENGTTNGSTTSLQPGSVTPNQNDSLIVTGFGFDVPAGTVGINGGFSTPVTTEQGTVAVCRGGSISYLIQTTAAAANPTWTTSNLVAAAAVIAAFKPAAGGDVTPPTLGSRAVPTGGTTLTGTLSESCVPSSGTGGFTLAGTSATVASWAIASGTNLTLTLSGTVYQGETVTLSYDRATTTDDIEDAAGNFLANFTNASVTNNSTQVAPEPAGGSVFRSLVISRGRPL